MNLQSTLEKIAERKGGILTPAAVVEAARDPKSVLHSHFTWDDTEAAKMHREAQARALIRSVKVEIKTVSFPVSAPFFVRSPEAGGREQGYTSLAHLRTDEDAARDVVVSEFARAAACLARAKAVALALDIMPEIESLHDSVRALSARVQGEARA